MTEFALIFPLMLVFLGLDDRLCAGLQCLDDPRIGDARCSGGSGKSATSTGSALTIAKRTVCLQAQSMSGFQPSASPAPNDVEQCVAPNVTIPAFGLSDTAPGASTRYPIGSATVQTSLPFQTLFAYPFITQNGVWTVVVRGSFDIVQGRQ